MEICWTNNCRGAANDALYVLHAFSEGNKTLCGCLIQEISNNPFDVEHVGCKNCLKIIRMKRRQVINGLWYQANGDFSSYSECSRCQTRLARGGRTCSECLTTELGDLIGDSDSAIALVRALIEYKDLEKEILE